jgi:hypothetical protein
MYRSRAAVACSVHWGVKARIQNWYAVARFKPGAWRASRDASGCCAHPLPDTRRAIAKITQPARVLIDFDLPEF